MYGSKIDNLIKLRDNGFNVPAFTVVPYEEAVREDLEIKLPSSGKLFSVRSSANVEDGEFQSFAGQFDTFLNVPEDEVSGKIKDIINTLNSDSVKAYAESKNISITDIRMNIIQYYLLRIIAQKYCMVFAVIDNFGSLRFFVFCLQENIQFTFIAFCDIK